MRESYFMNSNLVKEWYDFAEMDFISASHLMSLNPIPVEIVCYHCQQSAVSTRYPHSLDLTIKDARDALDAARQIKKYCINNIE